MAGPNKSEKPDFFESWPVLESEIRAYLAERQAGDPQELRDQSRSSGPGKALLNFLSVDPAQMATENVDEADEWGGEVDVLAYSELARYGYEYLVQPMMKAGGYAVVSQRMGIDLNERVLKDRAYYARTNPPIAVKKQSTDGFLTLGRAREERLDSVAEIDRNERRRVLFEKQAMMDKTKRRSTQEGTARKSGSRSTSSGISVDAGEDLRRAPGLPPELRGRSEWVPSADDVAPPPEPLLFSFPQRANTVALVGVCALAYGRGTVQALEKGLLTNDVADVAVPASLFLLGLSLASAIAGGSLARSKGRSIPLWVFKGALAGLPSVLELRSLPELDLRSESDEA